ncbi:Eco57I restriction-modification methylase domain-containing protein [Mucilaginibacter daejeonensis]|uniref:Eco57I restriction-modification methylase domain-containing protein n=1 Tax=Mucilaginibacter daejeonensis TaxID=398049 RepID=UPI001D17AB89|nr:Eco57I restriction-modification methylase domain-containing protein [Mucilaginibacter daejeonensis]UEG55035.1 Eco57I restriction-modification methylase domain-containing protein [Mucilaginibacter daejeonensis]
MKFTSSLKPKLIYVFRINDEAHSGCLKIGEATSDSSELFGLEPNSSALNKAAKKRIDQYTQTAGIAYELLYTEFAVYLDKGVFKAFSDVEVHQVLIRSGIQRKLFDIEHKANEWFITDLDTVKKAIAAVKAGRDSLHTGEITIAQNPVIFRPEQKAAIQKTIKQFKKGDEMLWFAKMRFGKTLSALQVLKEEGFKRTLILTHRPVVDKGWFEDFAKIFFDSPNYAYGSKNQGHRFATLEKLSRENAYKYVYFVSMQDLRGSELVGGNFSKNDEIYRTTWDYIIIDEAHEGTQTELGKNVLSGLKKSHTKILQLSGTPFNLLDSYKEEEIYTWDYVMEQKAKAAWNKIHWGDPNPYAALPKLHIYTYDLGKLLRGYIDEEVAFNFREFFRVNEDGSFLHQKDVISLLNLICKADQDSNYPYSTSEYRDNFRHSLWMLPGVKEAKALSRVLKSHSVFSHFEIVNVAGEGDEEETNEEALNKVNKAIGEKPQDTYTITLSCGRLTTGVSVPAWTAVFMLAGSYNTSAAGYMQTIFRVQTPATINGKVKEDCFVFDFAPDRTLKVIAETAKVSSKAGKTTGEDRIIMGEFLNFCPIIAVQGSQMKSYDVNGMLEQLKKTYVERVVRNGFEDGYLYNNDELMKLDALGLEDFDGLKQIIGSTKAIPKTGYIDINSQGFTDEEYEQLEVIKKKNKNKLTDEEKLLLGEKSEKKKNRDSAVSILRGISIRMPLLIYGADVTDEDEISIDNFTDLVDNQSWQEFMPTGVTKSTFLKFKKYYEPDVFRAAGKRIRALARAADHLTIEERIERITSIFSTFRNPDKETVLTPWRVVNMHLGDCFGGYNFLDEAGARTLPTPQYIAQGVVTDTVFSTNSKVLEINSKSGFYPLYIAYSIFRRRISEKYDGTDPDTLTIEQQLTEWDATIAKNIFIICKTPMAKSITKRTLIGFRHANINARYFEDLVAQIKNKPENFIRKIRNGQTYWKSNNDTEMKFNAIVGNPPYMEMDGGAQASAKPIYNQFVEIAKKIEPQYISMIMPSRWYSGGRGLDEFRSAMLNDKRISLLHDFLNPELVFPKTNIRGGICYFLWDKNYNNEVNLTKVVTHKESENSSAVFRSLKPADGGTFVRHNEAISIIEKVSKQQDFQAFSKYVSPLRPFGFRGYFTNDEKFRETDIGLKHPVICYGKGKKIGYVERDEITTRKSWIYNYKVFTARANNIGTELNDDNLNAFVGVPGTICTESYLVMGAELKLDQVSAQNLCKYFSTKFLRFMHSIAKASQDATSKTYQFVPLQNLTPDSDIDWSQSISAIDKQLYTKYKLDENEIKFIEEMIKEM